MTDTFLEVHKNYAENIVVGFARLGGKSIGIVANQPAFLAGVLILIHLQKQHVLFVSATALIFHYWCSKMYQDFCQEQIKNGMES
jgi:hypothetical protein